MAAERRCSSGGATILPPYLSTLAAAQNRHLIWRSAHQQHPNQQPYLKGIIISIWIKSRSNMPKIAWSWCPSTTLPVARGTLKRASSRVLIIISFMNGSNCCSTLQIISIRIFLVIRNTRKSTAALRHSRPSCSSSSSSSNKT